MAHEVEAGVRTETGTLTFGDRVAAAVDTKRSQLVVGLDPRPELLPVELRGDTHHSRAAASDAVGRFCRGLVDAVAPYVVGVKAQLAYFETLGADGVRVFEDVCDYARAANLLVIADAKRGDIGSTARAYADAYLERREDRPPPVDALTVSPYLGSDSIEPFVAACRRSGNGIFCLVKTSNAGSADLQDAALSDGRRLWHQVAELVDAWGQDLVGERGLSSVGAVVGATYPRAVAEARKLMPQAILLLPGIGAQGGTPADVARAFTSGPASALIPVSRSVIYAFRVEGADWRSAAAGAAARLRDDVWAVSGW
jgi:orotidine-5'-phosphate decarboxylase